MSVVTFWGSGKTETGQTTSMAAIATLLSLEQNYKILLINTKCNDTALVECFWEQSVINQKNDLETGISGLVKAISSNKTTPEIITNYTKTVFKGRLEVLTDNNISMLEYEKQKEYMKKIVMLAKKYYDLVFVDIEGSLEDEYIKKILQESNLIVMNPSQRIKHIKQVIKEANNLENFKKENIMFLIGKYDRYSKYNVKNLQRMERRKELYGIPYNTLFFEQCNDGKLADFIINYRRAKMNSTQRPIIEALTEISVRIIEKLKEMQMQI